MDIELAMIGSLVVLLLMCSRYSCASVQCFDQCQRAVLMCVYYVYGSAASKKRKQSATDDDADEGSGAYAE